MHIREAYVEVIASINRCDSLRTIPHRLPSDRYALSNTEYFFTICAREHGVSFNERSLADRIIDALLRYRDKSGWTMYCYCLMPDHLHFIVQLPEMTETPRQGGRRGTGPSGVLDGVGDFKSFTTSQVWWPSGGRGRLWQRSSYDRILRYDDSAEQAIRYVLNNPVRKGMVDVWDHYPLSGLLVNP